MKVIVLVMALDRALGAQLEGEGVGSDASDAVVKSSINGWQVRQILNNAEAIRDGGLGWEELVDLSGVLGSDGVPGSGGVCVLLRAGLRRSLAGGRLLVSGSLALGDFGN